MDRNLTLFCRTCMSSTTAKNAKHRQSIYEMPTDSWQDLTIIELLQSVQPQIQVQTEDNNLPEIMCLDCIQQLQITYEFLEKYKDTDNKLRKLSKEANFKCEPSAIGKDEFLTKLALEEESIDASYDDDDDQNQEKDVLMIEENTANIYEELQRIPVEDESGTDLSGNQFNIDTNDECTTIRTSKKESAKTTTEERNLKIKKPSKPIKDILIEQLAPPAPPKPNEDGSISCQECEKVQSNVTLWHEHMLGHSKAKLRRKPGGKKGIPHQFECEYCGKVFLTRTLLNNHVRTHTGEHPYLCIECGKSFKVNSSLNVHMLRHKGEKKYKCPHCPKNFVCSSALYGHVKRHETYKPFICDICGSSFNMAYQLKLHSRHHSDVRKFACEYCDKRFITSEKQQRHMRTHTGEKPYCCKYCDRAYAQSNDCNKHMKQHLGDNIFQCDLCPQRFPLVKNLRLHFATHKDDDEETRSHNLKARAEEERKLKIKFGIN